MWLKRELVEFYVKKCSVFFLKSLIICVFLFRSLIYLEFIFMYAVMEKSNFILIIISKKTCTPFSKWLLLVYLFADSLGGFPFS